MNNFVLAQIVGVLIIIANFLGDLQLKEKNYFIYNAITNILCSIQYLLLGGASGAVCCIIAVLRNICFSGNKKHKSVIILIIFLIISIIMSIITYDGLISLLPIINVLVFTTVLWFDDIKLIKKSMIFIGLVGSIYDICLRAYTGLLLNITDFVLGIWGTYQLTKENKKVNLVKNKNI